MDAFEREELPYRQKELRRRIDYQRERLERKKRSKLDAQEQEVLREERRKNMKQAAVKAIKDVHPDAVNIQFEDEQEFSFAPGDRVRTTGTGRTGTVIDTMPSVLVCFDGQTYRTVIQEDKLIPIRTTSEPYKPPVPPWIRGLKRIRAGEASFSLARKLKERKGEMRLEE